jgi:hypothetical protein
MKKILTIILAVFVIAGIVFWTQKKEPVQVQNQAQFDGKNSTFSIEGQTITLTNGVSEVEAAPGSAAKITTKYFGNEAKGDLNGDGLEDTAFLITQETGGSGLYYYVVVAMLTPNKYVYTNAFLIGDRISPQSTEIHSDSQELHVNYAERKPGEPYTTYPSQGAALILKVTSGNVLEGVSK